jgi:hypothetical protein
MQTAIADTEAPRRARARSFAWSVQTSDIGFMGPPAADRQGSAGCGDCTGGCILPADTPRSKRPGAPGPGASGERA